MKIKIKFNKNLIKIMLLKMAEKNKKRCHLLLKFYHKKNYHLQLPKFLKNLIYKKNLNSWKLNLQIFFFLKINTILNLDLKVSFFYKINKKSKNKVKISETNI